VGDIWTANYNTGDVEMMDLNQPAYDATACPTAPVNSSGGLFFYKFAGGSLTGPHGIAIDSSRNVWVTNNGGNTITKLIPNYTFCQTSAQHPATVSVPPGNIISYAVGNNPYGIAIDASGNVWVTNFGDNTVTKLSSSGSLLGTFAVGAQPRGIAIDPSGNVWVANSGSNTVTELSSSGSLLGTFTVGNGPHSIAIETSGNVWVTNFGSVTTQGNTVTELVFNGSTKLQNTIPFTVGKNPEGVAIDFWGNVWVTNYYDNTLTVWQGATTGPHFSPYAGPIWPQ
jgi:streptogramin lyase